MAASECAEFRIEGRVQGVGFRWWTRSQALRLHLTGSVRNCPDGSVLVMACGSPEHLAELDELLHAGPDGAVVERVDRSAADGAEPTTFNIERS